METSQFNEFKKIIDESMKDSSFNFYFILLSNNIYKEFDALNSEYKLFKISDIYYNNLIPLISLYKCKEQFYINIWIDFTFDFYNKYVLYEIKKEDILKFLKRKISLYEILKHENKSVIYFINKDGNWEFFDKIDFNFKLSNEFNSLIDINLISKENINKLEEEFNINLQ